MSLLDSPTAIWAMVSLVVLPVLIIGAGELEERLRQRDSGLRRVVSILRWWTLPLLVGWVLLRRLFDVPPTNGGMRLLATGLLISLTVATLAAVRVIVANVLGRRSTGDGRQVPQIVLALPRVAVIIVVGWLLLDNVWGVDLTAALTALGVTSLVVSFALQDTLSGLASGLLLLGDAPFRPGDWILNGELEGRVVDVNWRSTRLENRDGDLVVVPNAELAGATLINLSQPTRVHRVVVPVQVAYKNPPTRARAMLLDAARSTPNVLEAPAPRVRIVQIDDPLMGYEVDLWIDDARLAPQVSSEFGALVWYQSHRHDVPLPSPAYDLYVYDGVAVEEASKPDLSEVQRRLQVSPLFEQVTDEELARLARAGTPARFAVGETILGLEEDRGDLYVLTAGRARLTAQTSAGDVVDVGELGPGEIFGVLGRARQGVSAKPSVKALTDCEVIIVDTAAAGEVISRNTALSRAVDQTMTMRRQRIERLVGRQATSTAVTRDGAVQAIAGSE